MDNNVKSGKLVVVVLDQSVFGFCSIDIFII